MCSVCTPVHVTRSSLTQMIMMRKLLLNCMYIQCIICVTLVHYMCTCMYNSHACPQVHFSFPVLYTVLECNSSIIEKTTLTKVHFFVRVVL